LKKYIPPSKIAAFRQHLHNLERAGSTIEKYVREVSEFADWLKNRQITKAVAVEYKARLSGVRSPSGVNGSVAALNAFFTFISNDVRLNSIRTQAKTFLPQDKELTRSDYERLLFTARQLGNEQLRNVLLTLCSTGIRVSELRFVTVEAAQSGYIEITNKGKTRRTPVPSRLATELLRYSAQRHIFGGYLFVTRTGKPLDRQNIWRSLKALCNRANVDPAKVFPHNFRKLFARCFYERDKDIARLADILGHSDLNTTRTYAAVTFEGIRSQMDALNLVR